MNNEIWMVQKITELEKRIEALEKKEKRAPAKAFKPPTVEEVFNYMVVKKELHPVDAHEESEKFMDFYGCKNWFVGKNKMKNWKLAVNNWMRGRNERFEHDGKSKFERSIESAGYGYDPDIGI